MKTDSKSKIEYWAKILTDRIMDDGYFSKEEIEKTLKIYIPIVIKNCLEPHESSLIKQINDLKEKINICKDKTILDNLYSDLKVLNKQRGKEFNIYNSVKKIIAQDLRYKTLHDVVFEKVGKLEMSKINKEFNLRLNASAKTEA
jgi:hypothetical protein